MSESKQDVVVRMVQEQKYSREAIKEAADCTAGALASYLSGMRNAAKFTGAAICPIEIEDDEGNKVMVCKTFAEVEQIKEDRAATRGTAAAKKSPEERLEAAQKRLARSESQLDKFDDRISAVDGEISEELSLRFEKAKIEVRLAEIEISRLQQLVSSAEDEEDSDVGEDELL